MVIKNLPIPVLHVVRALLIAVLPLQIGLLYLSHWILLAWFKLYPCGSYRRSFVIGVTETAAMISALSQVFPSNYSCALDGNPYYAKNYSFGPFNPLVRIVAGPILLAFLSQVSDTFIYVSFTGFLAIREAEFKFLKSRGKAIVVLFCGSDIRSPKMTREFFNSRGEDCFVNYFPTLNSRFIEGMVKHTAACADRYADLIFNWRYDQISYLEKPTKPWPYIFDLSKYKYQFEDPGPEGEVIVLHCPSHPLVKGTPLVRAAVKQLHEQGYQFKYVEMQGVPHEQVMAALSKSHVVLQEFYCIAPGAFGIEALACGNVVLMAANADINPELPPDCQSAWIPTRYWQIQDKLKFILDNREVMKEYSLRGRAFVERHYSLESARNTFQAYFAEAGIAWPDRA